MIIKKETFLHSSFESQEEMELYYSLRDYLNSAGIDFNISLLHRYCQLQYKWIELFKRNPKHYMIDKYASHLAQLEESLCLSPKSLLAYQKDKVLIQAKQEKIKTDKP